MYGQSVGPKLETDRNVHYYIRALSEDGSSVNGVSLVHASVYKCSNISSEVLDC